MKQIKLSKASIYIIAAAVIVIAALAIILIPKGNNTVNIPVTDIVTDNPVAEIRMKDGGSIILELYPEIAPNTVANFIELANSGFYDGLIFHRVIPGFMIQGGDPKGNGTGNPGYSIKGEFALNGFENNLAHKRGIISMARSQKPDSAGSQFFIMHADAGYLDGSYAAFGEVRMGMDVVDRIASVKTAPNDKPLEDQVIASIRVDTKGKTYTAEKIK